MGLACELGGLGLATQEIICCPHLSLELILHSLIPRPPTQHLCLQAHVQAPLRIATVAYNPRPKCFHNYYTVVYVSRARTRFSRLGWGLNIEFEHGTPQ